MCMACQTLNSATLANHNQIVFAMSHEEELFLRAQIPLFLETKRTLGGIASEFFNEHAMFLQKHLLMAALPKGSLDGTTTTQFGRIAVDVLANEHAVNAACKDQLSTKLADKLESMRPSLILSPRFCGLFTAQELMYQILSHLNTVCQSLMERCSKISFGAEPTGPDCVLYAQLIANDPELLCGEEGIECAENDVEVLADICISEEYV